MDKKNVQIWSYFLLLENEICEIAKYIEFESPNYNTYSNANAKSILSICSEIDVLLKNYCTCLDQTRSYNIMPDYRDCIKLNDPLIENQEINLPRYGIKILPWKNVTKVNTKLKWWEAYNSIKHDRLQKYNLATLENVIESGGALFCLAINLIKKSEEKFATKSIDYRDITFELIPESKLFKFSDDSFYYNKLKMWVS